MRYNFKIIMILLLMTGCNDNSNRNERDQCYTDISPDIVLHLNDSVKIDMDKDGVQDFNFTYNHSFCEILQLDNSYQVSKGKELGSGGFPFDTIGYREVIDYPLPWSSKCDLYPVDVEYLGVRHNTSFQALFGWIKIGLTDSTVIIKEYYLSNDPEIVIRAGISEYN